MSCLEIAEATIKELKNMNNDEMIECKKDSERKCQEGITKMGFTFQHSDLPDFVKDAELGHRFYIEFVDADVYEQSMGADKSIVTKPETNCDRGEKSEGDKIRERACILCNEENFWDFLKLNHEHSAQQKEYLACQKIYELCNISSRKELVTNEEAQKVFKDLMIEYGNWGKPSIEEQYKHNLDL